MITEKEKQLTLESIEMALQEGAQHCRVNLSKSTTDLVDTLDGKIDKVSHRFLLHQPAGKGAVAQLHTRSRGNDQAPRTGPVPPPSGALALLPYCPFGQ